MKPTLDEQRVIDEGLAEISETRVADAKQAEAERIDNQELEAMQWDVVRDMRELDDEEELREAIEMREAERADDDWLYYADIADGWERDGWGADMRFEMRHEGEAGETKERKS